MARSMRSLRIDQSASLHVIRAAFNASMSAPSRALASRRASISASRTAARSPWCASPARAIGSSTSARTPSPSRSCAVDVAQGVAPPTSSAPDGRVARSARAPISRSWVSASARVIPQGTQVGGHPIAAPTEHSHDAAHPGILGRPVLLPEFRGHDARAAVRRHRIGHRLGVGLDHDPHERLGAGGPHQHPPGVAELLLDSAARRRRAPSTQPRRPAGRPARSRAPAARGSSAPRAPTTAARSAGRGRRRAVRSANRHPSWRTRE